MNLRSGGTDRPAGTLNVDYDNERDFTANNNIQVYYEGLEDEIVRRIEVGTVTFQPPQSRFITAAIPANNFGVNARFEVGPGSDPGPGRDPEGKPGRRAGLHRRPDHQPGPGPAGARPRLRERPVLLGGGPDHACPAIPRSTSSICPGRTLAPADRPVAGPGLPLPAPPDQSGANPNLGGITALARTIDSRPDFGPVRWQLLMQGTDYYLDPSGLWFALASKLDQNDYLAVSYRDGGGRHVGSFPAEDRGPQGSSDSLRLIVQPQHRARGADVPARDAADLPGGRGRSGPRLAPGRVSRSIASERPAAEAPSTYLALLGLAVPTDAATFRPGEPAFPARRATRRRRRSSASRTSSFPHLTPFADATRLTPAERSDSLYRTPLYLLLSQGPPAKFSVRLRYNSTGAGDRSTLNLGALQIREGSEQLCWAGGGWSGGWTTRSPTSWARSPSSTPTRSSAAAPPR